MADDNLVFAFLPALVVLLINAERHKGGPLTEAEVLEIRDKGTVMAVPRVLEAQVAEERGYADLDAENVWAEWQEVREELVAAAVEHESTTSPRRGWLKRRAR